MEAKGQSIKTSMVKENIWQLIPDYEIEFEDDNSIVVESEKDIIFLASYDQITFFGDPSLFGQEIPRVLDALLD